MYLVSGAGQVPRYYCLRVGAGGRTIGKPRQRTGCPSDESTFAQHFQCQGKACWVRSTKNGVRTTESSAETVPLAANMVRIVLWDRHSIPGHFAINHCGRIHVVLSAMIIGLQEGYFHALTEEKIATIP